MIKKFAVPLFAALLLAPIGHVFSQDATPNIDEEIAKALAAKPKSASEMKKIEAQQKAQLNEMMAENDKEEAAEKAKQKAEAQSALDAKGPVALPDWTPNVPQFTPSGPITRKLVDGQPMTVQSGTSPLSPEALCDAWDTFKRDKFSHERTGSDINHHVDLSVKFRNGEDNTEVKMEAERKPGAKVTQVTISSPLPVPAPTGDDN